MKWKVSTRGMVFCIIFLMAGAGFCSAMTKDNSSSCDITLLRAQGERRAIMLTGFWNPTGQMIASFSTDSSLNPGGWQGENWEDLGYDIYSFFPTPGSYKGDFEVDYQDTWDDFWRITGEVLPVAILSFGAGDGPWEIEYNARNLAYWINDDTSPYQPTPCPPDDSVPAGFFRHSTLPVQRIADAVNDQTNLEAWVDYEGSPGAYLCEYIAYLVMWYQAIHNTTDAISPCRTAGFIHVNAGVSVEDAKEATEITLRETIAYLKEMNLPPNTPQIDGPPSGNAGESYAYTFSTVDPDGDDVSYYIEWFEGCPGVNWEGPYPSGEEIERDHIWDEQGTYTIGVKAKDQWGLESDWATLEVSMPRMKEPTLFSKILQKHPLLYHLLNWYEDWI
jgi:pyrrolidone-carboxylate peptidase